MSVLNPSRPGYLQFHSPSSPGAPFRHVGIAIGEGALGPSGHVGLLYKDGDSVRCVHLKWHYRMGVEDDLPQGYEWVVHSLPELYAMQVAARCRRIRRANPDGLPYAPGPFGRFDATGLFVKDRGAHGFTCATFILAVFEAAGVPLVDVASWPIREDDETFRSYVVGALEEQLARQRKKFLLLEQSGNRSKAEALRQRVLELEKHVEAVRTAPVAARFRPEEVAAALALSSPPAVFPAVVESALVLSDYFERRDARP